MKRILLALILALMLFVCTSCNNQETDYSDYASVTFHLEGGVCKNNTDKVVYLYNLSQLESSYIVDPNVLSNREIISRAGYTLKGWYKTKNADGSYSDKWDFESDKITKDGVELYAWWDKNVVYTYEIYYLNNNEEVLLGSYKVSAGAVFDDYLDYSERRNYTCIGYLDAEGNAWDNNFRHPGGENSLAIKLYAQYIEGEYSVIRTAKDLKANKGKSIYLLNDIDFQGDEFSFSNYNKEFIGNGYTISNVTISYDGGKGGITGDGVLSIALFSGDTKNATVKDVNFKDVKVNINTTFSLIKTIQVSIVANSIDSTFNNVKVTGEVLVDSGAAPSVKPGETAVPYNIITKIDELCFTQSNTNIANCEVTLVVIDQRS